MVGQVTGAKMLTVADIAQRLGLCKMTIYRRIKAGELPAVRVGRSYRVDEADFAAYLGRARTDGDAWYAASG